MKSVNNIFYLLFYIQIFGISVHVLLKNTSEFELATWCLQYETGQL